MYIFIMCQELLALDDLHNKCIKYKKKSLRMVVYTYHLSTQEAKQKDHKFKASLGYLNPLPFSPKYFPCLLFFSTWFSESVKHF